MMEIEKSRKKSSMPAIIFLFAIVLFGFLLAIVGKAELSWMTILVVFLLLSYFSIYAKIRQSTDFSTVLCDSRFYVFTCILMYSVLPPIYCLLTLEENGGARVRSAYNATIYTSEELLKTLIMSAFFFVGLMVGYFIREHIIYKKAYSVEYNDDCESKNKKAFWGWTVVAIVSSTLYLIPFINGGFRVIQMGGTILDVDRTVSEGVIGKIQEVFFSADIMTASTIAMLYYAYRLNISQRNRRIILVATVLFQVTLAVLTTRRARGLFIILCAFVIYVYWYEKKYGKLPLAQISITGSAIVFLYLLEVFMGQRQTNSSIAGYIRLFDGITAYDSLLRATRETPSITMLSNIIYGLFRPIPILGKYIIQLLGMPTDAAPLYHWMAERYSVYQLGGGLAYTPQLEAYLCLGYPGCLLFGVIYGFVFAKKRSGLFNLFVIAMAFSIARGTLQVLESLLWPFWIIGYLFYDRLLFSKIRFLSRHKYVTKGDYN